MASASVLAPYSHATYAGLPGLGRARKHYRAQVAPRADFVFEQLTSLWNEHEMHDALALALVHRHFDMAPGELLVETEDLDEPGALVSRPTTEYMQEELVARTWKLEAGGVMVPYEFRVASPGDAQSIDMDSPKVAAFASALAAFLSSTGLLGVFGLTTVSTGASKRENATYEQTVGRANIVRPMTEELRVELQAPDNHKAVDAAWCFVKGGGPRADSCFSTCLVGPQPDDPHLSDDHVS